MDTLTRRTGLLLVDDHALVRDGIRGLVESLPGFQVQAEAATAREALARLAEGAFDLVLMDVSMPGMDGIEAAGLVRAQFSDVRTLMVSMHATRGHAQRAMQAGARGYCVKQAGRDELATAIRTVLEGHTFLSPLLGDGADGVAGNRLTFRQTQILELIALSHTSKEIARKLAISTKTVESHRTALMRQLDLHDLAGLVRYAIRTGLVAADAPVPSPVDAVEQPPRAANA